MISLVITLLFAQCEIIHHADTIQVESYSYPIYSPSFTEKHFVEHVVLTNNTSEEYLAWIDYEKPTKKHMDKKRSFFRFMFDYTREPSPYTYLFDSTLELRSETFIPIPGHCLFVSLLPGESFMFIHEITELETKTDNLYLTNYIESAPRDWVKTVHEIPDRYLFKEKSCLIIDDR